MKYTVYRHSINNNTADEAVTSYMNYVEAERFIARQREQESRFAMTSRNIFTYYIKSSVA